MTLPPDLAGYQQIVCGKVAPGDIVRDGTFAYPRYSYIVRTGDAWDGRELSQNDLCSTLAFYRKMNCPSQADGHTVIFGSQEYRLSEMKDAISKAKTYDEGKPPLAHLPWDGLRAVSNVQEYGHQKYGDFYNYKKGMEESRNISCAIRHLAAYMAGETLDPESKQSHLAHAACRILFILQNQHDGTAIDDRYKK